MPPVFPNATKPIDVPAGFDAITGTATKEWMNRHGIQSIIQDVHRMTQRGGVGTLTMPAVLLAAIHPDRIHYYQWLCCSRGNGWLTFAEINDVFGWFACPSTGLNHEVDTVKAVVERALRKRSVQRWQRRLGTTRMFNVPVITEDLRMAAVVISAVMWDTHRHT